MHAWTYALEPPCSRCVQRNSRDMHSVPCAHFLARHEAPQGRSTTGSATDTFWVASPQSHALDSPCAPTPIARNGEATRALAIRWPRRSETMRRLVLPMTAGLALVASAGFALAQPHERGGGGQGGPGGGGGGVHAPGGAPSGGGVTHGPG